MPHGGRRPGSGRKTNAQIKQAREILTQTMTEDQWKQLFRRLHKLALAGNMRAAALLLDYQFGNPYAEPKTEAPPIHIRTIEARLSVRPRLDAPRAVNPEDSDSIDQTDDDETDDDETDDTTPNPPAPRSTPPPPAPVRYGRMRYHGEENDDLMDGI